MERMAWTDERMDDFADRVGADVRELRDETRAMRNEMREMRLEMRELPLHMHNEIHTEVAGLRTELRGEIDDLRNIVMRFGGGLLVAQAGMIAALIVRG